MSDFANHHRQAANFALAGLLGGLSLEERERALDAAASVIARVAAEEALRVAERAFRGAVTALHETVPEVASWVASQIACRWISVEERLPEPFVWVLAYAPDAVGTVVDRACRLESSDGASWRWSWPTPSAVTHWMPLPEPPTQPRAKETP